MAGLFGTASSTSSASSNPTQGDLSGDRPVTSPPTDSISDIRFSPKSDHLAASSWDNKVRIYAINGGGESTPVVAFDHEAPALNCCWSGDGTKVFGAGADKAARIIDLNANGAAAQQVAAHDQPIRCVESFMHNGAPMLVTGSWDKTIKYWDLRTPNPVASIECRDRVYAMSMRNDNMLVVGTAERHTHVIDLRNPGQFYKTIQSPLKWQTRTVSCFIDGSGYAVGSIEGRCAIQYVEEKDSPSNFSFKCHRQTPPNDRNVSNVYAVNAISFHPQHGTFSTAGADGTFHFWDKDAKHRLKGYPEVGGTISSTDFNSTGTIFAYAVSYDWSKGYTGNRPDYANKIMLHPIVGDECKPRPKTGRK
ncbi:Nucleoporin GLE2 [Fulvia fulva]|uniref:Nucleoporin GLE2 n=1 Tax=Passalora fulva TaxID=5499 RepID=A0A9Q8PLC5_PASFU|nr:Nucleoporin GLE2 [Fulvia fulva]KAK4610586.1 Nucleoporin GLE2 [Fulvia fulva]KAK4610962.1 Nucleoporin GLE2 [Fulvia fulva]UJO24588.1 Nucleoporin GLE2 [Fulvia fulva]WPV21951.1 Nucleoporin GLE2 [Fulvia fulva]WPV37186.1 Nucleoporin GLE2 [Fulvia fulva]